MANLARQRLPTIVEVANKPTIVPTHPEYITWYQRHEEERGPRLFYFKDSHATVRLRLR
jgi:hypothetical protein